MFGEKMDMDVRNYTKFRKSAILVYPNTFHFFTILYVSFLAHITLETAPKSSVCNQLVKKMGGYSYFQFSNRSMKLYFQCAPVWINSNLIANIKFFFCQVANSDYLSTKLMAKRNWVGIFCFELSL